MEGEFRANTLDFECWHCRILVQLQNVRIGWRTGCTRHNEVSRDYPIYLYFQRTPTGVKDSLGRLSLMREIQDWWLSGTRK
jgi:hypothetical protein